MNAILKPIDIVSVDKGEPVTNTLQIAFGLGLTHKSVIQLVRTYFPDMQEFGKVRFESSNSAFEMANSDRESSRGRHTRYAVLNEQQATFLMTLMRNSPKVIEFKKALVRSFFEARAFIQSQDQTYNNIHNKISLQLGMEKADASLAGHILGSYRKKRDVLVTALTEVERLMQPCLPFEQ
ncbi:hypothetical protein P256_00718 [Acinetobacter nectaris CIP 110549]|uniref:Rha family transcriptional regulator n=1 Tax=Acinetobacter nectaris CIP 110549 TaxID=1392540 RepID=V2TQI5_9GAMM|nr:Rha family transcriptional regulator [Acinetobacter nectaris]ESK40271.1 hypothetical protein P256_00718 [Acinetobacter nectaris CIP 110549]